MRTMMNKSPLIEMAVYIEAHTWRPNPELTNQMRKYKKARRQAAIIRAADDAVIALEVLFKSVEAISDYTLELEPAMYQAIKALDAYEAACKEQP